jgi:ParB family chromosome partitioning protein
MQKLRNKSYLETGRVCYVPVDSIQPNPTQPRRIFDEEALGELAESIRQYGVIQPLSVRRRAGGYELVAGERRLRASKLAGLAEVPCILLTVDEEESGMIALVENLQRRDLDFIEEAEGIARLMRLYGLSQEQAAARIGKSQSAVANKLRLLRHSPAVLAAVRENHLSERHARALLRLPGEAERLAALDTIIRRGMNVAQTEQYIDRLLDDAAPAARRAMPGFRLRDIRLFLNTLDHNLDLIRSAGFDAELGKNEDEREIVLTIRIPKTQTPVNV